MADWRGILQVDLTGWLLEPDNPSVRYLTLRHILDRPEDDAELAAARGAIPSSRQVQAILAAQYPEGYWMHPGIGYSPKYRATVWQIIFLAQLGAPRNEAIARGCQYVLAHARLPDGRFSAYKNDKGAINCLNGNLVWALQELGYRDDVQVVESREALAAQVLRDGLRCRCNPPAGAKRPPIRMSEGLPCAWGAVKVLKALLAVPAEARSDAAQEAIELGVGFLLDHDLARADYPSARGPSRLWFKLGFPLGYTSDMLETLEVLAMAGITDDPRLEPALAFVLSKQDDEGRWALERTPGKMWTSFGRKGKANKWVTWRVMRVIKLSQLDVSSSCQGS